MQFAHLLRGVAAGTVLASHLGYLFWVKPHLVADLILFPDLERVLAGQRRLSVPDFGLPDFWGYFGVGLFFLISGFVVPFSISRLSRGSFAVARAWRIWPTYMAGLTLALATLAANAAFFSVPFPYRFREILFHYLIVPRWPTLTRPIDGILWTLEVEIFFYLLCAICAYRLRRFDKRIFGIGLLSVPAAVLALPILQRGMPAGFPLYALSHWGSSMLLFAGFMLIGTASHYHFCGRIGRSAHLILQTGLFVGFTVAWRLGPFAAQGWVGPIAFFATVVVFDAACAGRETIASLHRGLLRPLNWLADLSYPLYVVHGVFGYTLLAHCLRTGAPAWAALGLSLAAVLGLSGLLHVVVEVPTREFGRNLALRLEAKQVAPAPRTARG